MTVERVRIEAADGAGLDAVWHPAGDPAAPVVVLAHGLSVDLTENGLYPPLAEALVARGMSALRFSFRGHGNSDGTSREMTIAGECLDLEAAVAFAAGRQVAIVASSFGAVSTALLLGRLSEVRAVVLWQPVLDLRGTFVDPVPPGAVALFGDKTSLREKGFLDYEGRFELSADLFAEFDKLDPLAAFTASTAPALVIHGDADANVSFDVARTTATTRPHTDWHPVPGAEHGFLGDGESTEIITATVDWLATTL